MSVSGAADRVGELAQHEPVGGADLLGGGPGLLRVAEAHERDGRVPAAESFPYRRRDRAVAEHEPGPGGFGRVAQPVQRRRRATGRRRAGRRSAATAAPPGPAAGPRSSRWRGTHRAPGCRPPGRDGRSPRSAAGSAAAARTALPSGPSTRSRAASVQARSTTSCSAARPDHVLSAASCSGRRRGSTPAAAGRPAGPACAARAAGPPWPGAGRARLAARPASRRRGPGQPGRAGPDRPPRR